MTQRLGGMIVSVEPSVRIPEAFLTDVLPLLTDTAEIHVMFTVLRLVDAIGDVHSPLNERQIARDASLRQSLRMAGSPNEPDRRIRTGLDLAVGRGTLLRFATGDGVERQTWYMLTTLENEARAHAMARGTIPAPMVTWTGDEPPRVTPERPNVFRMYEQNIGLLTPLLADQLVTAMERFPIDWIEDAIGEAVSYNRRSWRYIQRILDGWETSGRSAPGEGRRR